MKKILGIETATLAGGVALMDEARLIAEYRLHVEVRYSERLLTAIDHLLKESRVALADLDGIAVSVGPGSFTGLRVGLATAKGLAMGAGKPLLTIPTLEAMAAGFRHAHPLIAPVLHARRDEVYWALFDHRSETLIRLHPDAASSPQQALEEIGRWDEEILFVGEGALRHRDLILERRGKRALFPSRSTQFPSAANVAELGLSRLLRGETTAPEEAAPIYLRESQAELKWRGLKGKIGIEGRPSSGSAKESQ
ncbi:MAG TPA: tRNA (adenosine(37)-N6)-threonylcarbamoyltransferase complex dimerization subunit type 1 TsaB [Candidatus Manganitrophaceae bacterium]|nr:tRNA (adenosine(37)-N6)-threonylcarbamoyltransferase complex dimerization subunit type 1 TsaB [Candidatus Manganitrophaceae bacterium]